MTRQCRRAGVIADLACGHEKPDWTAIGIGNGMQLGVHAALRAADQTAPLVARPPFFDRRLVAVLQSGQVSPGLFAVVPEIPSSIRPWNPLMQRW